MPEEVLIKSKERVHRFAEVFTPLRVVRDMCDMLERESPGAFDPERTFLEPTCGEGAFVLEILRRKFERCKTPRDYRTALKSVYAMEIQTDNVQITIEAVKALCSEHFRLNKDDIQTINDNIIMCDSLKVMRLLSAMELIKDAQITVLECRNTDKQRMEAE
jgi:hypothetical protein